MPRTFVSANKHFLLGGIMRKLNVAPALLTAVVLAACGGGGGGGGGYSNPPWTPPPPVEHIRFTAQVTFGDGLSDVGSYAVGAVRDLNGGQFTINGNNTAINPALTGINWTTLMAAKFDLPAPCAALTGLDGDPARGFSVLAQAHAGCFGYAQGGARVSNSVGPFNRATGSQLGALTLPLAAQVANHLAAVGGTFSGSEIIFVNAGGSDLAMQLRDLKAYGDPNNPTDAKEALAAMTTAASELGDLIKLQMLAKGAKYIVVLNLPDPSSTPGGRGEPVAIRKLATEMAAAFNDELRSCVTGLGEVVLVDLDALMRDEVANPSAYGLANATDAACGPNTLGGLSLVCNATNTVPWVDVSHYMFADFVHPTPFQHSLMARNVAEKMMAKGWL
jgi:phospholipase/lecithinase/hemolysin